MSEPIYEKPPPYSPYPSQPVPGNAQAYAQPYLPPPSAGVAPSVATGYASPNWLGTQSYPNYGSTVIVQPEPAPQIIIVGGCPVCRVGILEEDFTCAGIFLALVCFPIGILCCLALRQRRCPNCGASFD